MNALPYLHALPFSRRHALGCDCAPCRAQLGAEAIAPQAAQPPAGPLDELTVPPADKVAVVRAQAAEAFRRAVWEAAGKDGWTEEARAAWSNIANLPAMPAYDAQPGQVRAVVETWLRRAEGMVPTAWAASGDPRGAAAADALSAYAGSVLAQLDTYNPVTLYNIGLSWRSQAIADKAAGLYDRGVQAAKEGAQAIKETIENASPGLGFGAVLGLGVLGVAAVAVLAPELSGAAASRAASGWQKGYAKGRR